MTISVMYSYEWDPALPESERKFESEPSEEFCRTIMEMNMLYTRAEIEQISGELGYSVFDRRGGDGCKHVWKSNTVVEKDGKTRII
jgi:hypothetical protein